MTYTEHANIFECAGEQLVAITTVPESPACSTGVLLIVGGPQYRVGSHRQFVHLCRKLAKHGIPSMRFDGRGMGDATGAKRDFDQFDDDVSAAADYFRRNVPSVDRIVLWGLCDGASAACFYAHRDQHVAGLVLLNPWVRTASSEAKTYLKHYYLKRLFDLQFWKKLWSRQVALGETASNIFRALRLSRSAPTGEISDKSTDLPSRMAAGLEQAKLPLLVILSGNDYVANEFEVVCQEHEAWQKLMSGATVERLANADHTFSTADWRDAVAKITATWVLETASQAPSPTARTTS